MDKQYVNYRVVPDSQKPDSHDFGWIEINNWPTPKVNDWYVSEATMMVPSDFEDTWNTWGDM